MRNLTLSVVIVGALCSVVKTSFAICSYDKIKEYYFDLEKDAKKICITDKYAAVCTSLKTAEMINPPVLEAVPESIGESQRKKIICRNNEEMSLWYQAKANLIRYDLELRSLNKFIDQKNDELKKDVVPPAKAQSNADILEIRLRDNLISKIRAEIKKHLDVGLNDADIDVLAARVCRKDNKPITSAVIGLLLKESKDLYNLCKILTGK